MQQNLPSRPSSLRTHLKDAVRLLAVVGVVLGARASLADHYYVPSGSMEPTVAIGDRLLVNKLAYGLRVPGTEIPLWSVGDPARGDVAVFTSPETGDILVKRVIAVPGDEVTVRDGHLILNGAEVPVADEAPAVPGQVERLPGRSHTLSLHAGGGPDYGPQRVPAGRYLMMGDNRGNSHDGRSFGLVPRERFVGRVEGLYVHQGRLGWHGAI